MIILYEELAKLTGETNLIYAPGYTEKGDAADETLIQEALRAAGQADVVLVFVGLTDMDEVEGIDRKHMQLPAGHAALIRRLSATHQKVVVVLRRRPPIEMPWVNDVSAILEGYLGGQAGAGALGGYPDRPGQPQRQAGRDLPDQTTRHLALSLPRRPSHGGIPREHLRRLSLLRHRPCGSALPLRARLELHQLRLPRPGAGPIGGR